MSKILSMLFVSMLSIPAAFSQNDSLYLYVETAIKNNPGLRQKYTLYRAALQKVSQAGSLQDPQFNISYFLKPMELLNGRQIAEMSLMQMFPWFGVLRNAKDEMTNMAFARFEEYRESGLQLAFDVQSTWFELYRVRKTAGITHKNSIILKTIEEIALTRYRTSASDIPSSNTPVQSQAPISSDVQKGSSMQGMNAGQSGTGRAATSPSMPMAGSQMEQSSGSGLADLYRLKMEAADLENLLSSLADQDRTLTTRFNILLDRPEDKYVFVPDTLVTDPVSEITAFDAGTYGENPMLGMIEFEKKAFSAREKMSRNMGLPMVGLGIGYSVIASSEMITSEMNGRDMVMPMASVTIPVWRKKYRSMRQEAGMLAESADQQYRSVSNDLRTEHNEAIRIYRDALRRVELYRSQKELASNTLDLLRTRLSVSSSALTDILRVQQQLLDYGIREVEAVTDLNRAVAQIKRIMAVSLNEIKLKGSEE